jgi:hypothetical protein
MLVAEGRRFYVIDMTGTTVRPRGRPPGRFLPFLKPSPGGEADSGAMGITEPLRRMIDTLRRQRVRQGNSAAVLGCLIDEAIELGSRVPAGIVHDTAAEIRARSFELQCIAPSVPKFVVEDLIDECIARLEKLAAEGRS